MRIETALIRHDAARVPHKRSRRDAREPLGHIGAADSGAQDESRLHSEALVRFQVASAASRVLALVASVTALVIAGGAAIRPF